MIRTLRMSIMGLKAGERAVLRLFSLGNTNVAYMRINATESL